jgi:hypothetical protein
LLLPKYPIRKRPVTVIEAAIKCIYLGKTLGRRSAEKKPFTSPQRSGKSIRLAFTRKMNGIIKKRIAAKIAMSLCEPLLRESLCHVYLCKYVSRNAPEMRGMIINQAVPVSAFAL